MIHNKIERTLRERVAMAMCGCDTFTFQPMMRSADGALHLPEDESFERRQSVCVCARDDRRPVETIMRCAEMLLKADAALLVVNNNVSPEPTDHGRVKAI